MASNRLAGVSMSDLQSEIRRRERKLSTLKRKRDRLASQLRDIDEEIIREGGAISAMGGTSARKRPRNDQNLADALASLLSKKTLSVTAAAAEVQQAGYRTTSPNFRTIVNQTLLKDKRFKRVGRGLYTSGPVRGGKKTSKSKKKKTSKRRTSRAR